MKKMHSFLARIPLFSGLSVEQLDRVERIARHRTYQKGERVFSEGDDGDGFYVVLQGQVKIFKVSPEGKEHILHIFGSGEPFGEVPVFSGKPFPANAQALRQSELIFFPKSSFIRLIAGDPSLSLNMLAVLSMRLRQFTVQIENLSLKEVPGRLASYLLFLADEQGDSDTLTLNVSKAQIASLLGTIPETLSRILGKMAGQQLIETSGRQIKLLDRPALEELAEEGRLT